MEKLVIVDGESYKDWITEISNEFKRSQIRAAVKINDEMLRLNYILVPEIVHKLWTIRLSFLEFLGDIIEQ